jgi:hypothetical protein
MRRSPLICLSLSSFAVGPGQTFRGGRPVLSIGHVAAHAIRQPSAEVDADKCSAHPRQPRTDATPLMRSA